MTNIEPTIQIFVLPGPNRTWSYDFGIRIVWTIWTHFSWNSIDLCYQHWSTKFGLQDWWVAFFPNSYRRNYPFMETWPDMAHVPPIILILHMPPASKARHSKQLAINALHILKVDHLAEIRLLEHIKTLHVIIDPNIFRVKTSQHYSHHNSSNINLLKMQFFLINFNPEKLFEVPQVGDRIFGPACHFEAPGHRSPWRPPRRLSKAGTPQPRRGRWALPSAAAFGLRRFPGAVGRCGFGRTTAQRPRRRGDESCGNAELYTRSTDKGTMNVLDPTSSKLFKAKNFHKPTEQVSRPLDTTWPSTERSAK